VSIGEGSSIIDSRVKNTIIQKNTKVSKTVLENSLLGNFAIFEGKSTDLSLGDFSTVISSIDSESNS
jgi:glucose-1-phosphate thymidylyltransferase